MMDQELLASCGEAFLHSDKFGKNLAVELLCRFIGITENTYPETYLRAKQMLLQFRAFLLEEDRKGSLSMDISPFLAGYVIHWDHHDSIFLNNLLLVPRQGLNVYYKNSGLNLDMGLKKNEQAGYVLVSEVRTAEHVSQKRLYLDKK